MILQKDVHHPNDVSITYLQTMHPEKLHSYFGMPGNFVRNYPRKIIRRDGSEREMDWLYLVEPDYELLFEEMLINFEFQSVTVGEEKISVIADYRDYSKTYYGLPVLSVIVIFVDSKNSEKVYEKTESDILKPIYISFSPDEIKEKLKNLERKITNHEKLTDDEALDIAFLPMFASKKEAKSITEKIVNLFSIDTSIEGAFRNDIAYVLAIMIRKYFDGSDKARELFNMVENYVTKADLMDVIEYELDYRDRTRQADIDWEVERRINNLKPELEEGIRSELEDDIKSELAEKDAEIDKKDAEIDKKDAEIDKKDAKIAELKAKLKEHGIE